MITCHNFVANSMLTTFSFYFQNVTVNNEFERILEVLQKKRVFRVDHGPVLRKGTDIERARDEMDLHRDPLTILFEYMKKENMRVIDLFQRLDADGSESVTREEFKSGLLVSSLRS